MDNMKTFDTPQAVVLLVGVALILLVVGGHVFASANVGVR